MTHYPEADHGMWCATCNFNRTQEDIAVNGPVCDRCSYRAIVTIESLGSSRVRHLCALHANVAQFGSR